MNDTIKTRPLILNCPIDLYSMEDVVEKVKNAIENKINLQLITINPEMIMYSTKNNSFLEIIKNSSMNIPDGIGVKIALKFNKINYSQIRGIDLSRQLIKLADENNYSIGFLGAKEEVISKAKENFITQYPNLKITYTRNGYFNNEDEIINEIKSINPQILFVGLGSPKQEELISKLKTILSGTVMIGVGGSFDVFSGLVKEAPYIYRKLGLEWFYRTICEPKRLKRIFPTLPLFLIKCIIDSVVKKG